MSTYNQRIWKCLFLSFIDNKNHNIEQFVVPMKFEVLDLTSGLIVSAVVGFYTSF